MAGILFSMNFSPKEEKKLKVRYIQDHDGTNYWLYPDQDKILECSVSAGKLQTDRE